MTDRGRVFLLSGPKFSGKSRFVERLARGLGDSGVLVSGFVQRGVFDDAGNKVGYDLVDLATGAFRPLARIRRDRRHSVSDHAPPLRSPERGPGGEVRGSEMGGWVFDDSIFGFAAAALDPDADLAIIDEVGPLELSGKGHRPALEAVLGGRAASLLVVREELTARFEALLAPRFAVTRVRYDPQTENEVAVRFREILLSGES